jgi:2'-5' RNA ligase
MKTGKARDGHVIPSDANSSRLFVAITLLDVLKAKLAGLRSDFPNLKWATPETMHLTLRFIGQTPEERVDAVRRSLRDVRRHAFCLTVAGLGLFQRRDDGILWAGVQEESALPELKRLVDDALRSGAGLDLKNETFSPHLTLSRLKKAPSRELKDAVKAKVAECFGEMPVTSFTLFRSLLRPTGAVHEAVETYPMEGSC